MPPRCQTTEPDAAQGSAPRRRARKCFFMDVSPTLATGGNDAAVEPSRPSRRAAPALQAPALRPDPEFMHNAVANDLVARFSAYQSDPLLASSAADLLR